MPGLHEIRSLIAGEIDRPTCEELIKAATRQYAKRQETWFRSEPAANDRFSNHPPASV